MTDDGLIFDFERDFAGTLRCVPMVVRLKLDLCGVKLSLNQWSHLTREDRDQLLVRPCETDGQRSSYRDALVRLIADRTGQAASMLPIEAHPEWIDIGKVPDRLKAYAVERGAPPPSRDAWAALSPQRRFALFKLTRPGHDNDNFIPAMREFGLLDADLPSATTSR